MSMHRWLAAAALTSAVMVSPVRAQDQFGIISYNYSVPTNDAKAFTDNDSWLGFYLDFRRYLNPDHTLSVGTTFGWTELYWKTNNPINFTFQQNGAGTIQSTQYRDLNIFPFMVGGDYYFHMSSESNLKPFIGASLGVYYIHQTFDIGTVTFNTDNWIFGWAPELGVLIGLSNGGQIALYARYNWPVNAGSFLPTDDNKSMRFLSIGVGLGFAH